VQTHQRWHTFHQVRETFLQIAVIVKRREITIGLKSPAIGGWSAPQRSVARTC
jgi:hypothetical protein